MTDSEPPAVSIIVANLRKAALGLLRGGGSVVTRQVTPGTSALGLTVSQAALHLGVSIATVRRWSNAGHLQSTRTPGGQRRFTVEQLDAFVASLQPRSRDVA